MSIQSPYDIPFDESTEGPMLKSIRLLKTAHSTTLQHFSMPRAYEILQSPLVHYFPIYIFIDIDLFQAKDGHLSESFQEICKLLLSNKTCIYGLSSKTLSSSHLDYLSLFTSVHFHNSDDEKTKAATIKNIIKDDIGEGYSTTIFFG